MMTKTHLLFALVLLASTSGESQARTKIPLARRSINVPSGDVTLHIVDNGHLEHYQGGGKSVYVPTVGNKYTDVRWKGKEFQVSAAGVAGVADGWKRGSATLTERGGKNVVMTETLPVANLEGAAQLHS